MSKKKRYGNFLAHRAAHATRAAHQNAPPFRTFLIVFLFLAWAGCGWWAFSLSGKGPLDAAYATFTFLGVSKDNVSVDGLLPEVARFAGLVLPLVSVLFAFYGVVFRTLCRIYLRFSKGHVVIAGDGPAALHLAQCCAKDADVVVLILQRLEKETLSGLAKQKIIVLEGDATLPATLITARAAHASHLCAMMDDEAGNLRIEAACQSVAAKHRGSRAKPLILHILLPNLLLRREARDLRKTLERERKASLAEGKSASAPMRIETRPFSLTEIGVRQAMISLGPTLLDRCAAEAQTCPHLLLIGLDDVNEAMAAWVLTRMWSAHFGPPRITVLSSNGRQSQSRFAAHFPEAQAHGVWQADIAFESQHEQELVLDVATLSRIEAKRGPLTAICVSLGDDSSTLSAALALLSNYYEAQPPRPMPILMRETTLSEFSKRYGHRNTTEADCPFLVAFGQIQNVAEPSVLLEGEMDRAAALYHFAYEAFLDDAGRATSQRKMDYAARGGWEQLGETYRHANRALADHAAIKLWDGGYRPAAKGENGQHDAQFDPELTQALSRMEHARWNAERLLDGWKPGESRENRARIHPSLVPWDSLSADDQGKDRLMVGLAAKVTKWIYRDGVLPREDRRGA